MATAEVFIFFFILIFISMPEDEDEDEEKDEEFDAMSRLLTHAGALIDRIKINVVRRECRAGRVLWIKHRRWSAAPIVRCANRFFALAGHPVQALADHAAWQRWEVRCFLRLHGENFRAFAEGRDAVAAEEVPGHSLARHLEAGTLTPPLLAAAGRELRRAHEDHCAFLGGAWSHGDPHAGNFIYDAADGRARLIDFEVMHHPALPAAERHAEDLLVLLQDVVGRISGERWLPCAHAFLAGYARPEILARLRAKLVLPRGLPRWWWAVRTTYLAAEELRTRLAALRASL